MKELKFIHITKTAGTSIEDSAKKAGINWGRFDKSYNEYDHWHTFFPNKPLSLRLKYDWFMVVRNPYTRIISEYHCKAGGIGKTWKKHTIQEFNQYLKDKITRFTQKYTEGNHYSEQYKYLDSTNDVKIHILRYENLKKEFEKLMSYYNLNIKLNSKSNTPTRKLFTIQDLSDDLIQYINKVYKKDFEIFNYNMIT